VPIPESGRQVSWLAALPCYLPGFSPVVLTRLETAYSGWDRSRFSRLSLCAGHDPNLLDLGSCPKQAQPFVREYAPGLPPLFQIVVVSLAKTKAKVKAKVEAEVKAAGAETGKG